MADLLDSAAFDTAMATLQQWQGSTDGIERTVAAPTFLAGIDLVDAVAKRAEEMNHHPDIDIRWRNVTFRLTTHDAGGVTDLDITLATFIDEQEAALQQ
jgi:4a-hydroxytetrahydrobiopterin dehydratase